MTEKTQALSDAGVSIWLDDLSRERLETGNLQHLIDEKNVVGVTTNPTIFAAALKHGDVYAGQLRELAAQGLDVDAAVEKITTDDVRWAADILRPVYDRTNGYDGYVSIEVDPRLSRDTEGTLAMARRLWQTVDRPNVMIKIPATVEGLPAITAAIADGINVNVTLIFSIERYRSVMDAYLDGLTQAREKGLDLSRIASVASFFISRVDTAVDTVLDGTPGKSADLKGKAAVANGVAAYQAYKDVFERDSRGRWAALRDAGARPQRPLWASTGVKNPDYRDTMYVEDLVAPGVVNTMPEATLNAVADHGNIAGDTMSGAADHARHVLKELDARGVKMSAVTKSLEDDGLAKFEQSWAQLLDTVQSGLDTARSQE